MTDHERVPQVDERALAAVAKAICRVQLNGGDPDQPAIRWNGTQMEPQDFPAWHDYRDEAFAALSSPAQEPVAFMKSGTWGSADFKVTPLTLDELRAELARVTSERDEAVRARDALIELEERALFLLAEATELLRLQRAYVQHWQDDVTAGLKPTQESLQSAAAKLDTFLSRLHRKDTDNG